MKILVPLKRTADPDNANKVKVSPDRTRIVTDGMEPKLNPFDEYAVEAALRLTENGKVRIPGDSITVVTLAPKEASQTLRQALAMGADNALHYLSDDAQLDGDLVARSLARVAADTKPDLVLLGKQAVDGDSNQVGQLLAEILQWPSATFAMSLDLSADRKTLVVGREVDGGVVRLRLTLPAVVTVDLRIVGPRAVTNHVTPASFTYGDTARFAPLPAIIKAKTKPLTEAPLGALGVDLALKSRYTTYELPAARKAGVKVKDVQELVQRLRTEAKVL